jgi:hypothetical protein
MTPLAAFCHWLAGTPASIALRESIWVYPIVESIHVLTLCVFLGLTVVLDLRLLGTGMRATPVSQLIRHLMPWVIGGFLVMVASGALLFYASPVRTYHNIFFRLKLAFLVAAGVNAAVFHGVAARTMPQWDYRPKPPPPARLAAGLSLVLWAVIVVCGRMIAYNWFDDDPATPNTH